MLFPRSSELIIENIQEAATRIVQEHEVISLSREEQIAFVSALLAPSGPGRRISKAVQSYRQKTGR